MGPNMDNTNGLGAEEFNPNAPAAEELSVKDLAARVNKHPDTVATKLQQYAATGGRRGLKGRKITGVANGFWMVDAAAAPRTPEEWERRFPTGRPAKKEDSPAVQAGPAAATAPAGPRRRTTLGSPQIGVR
jgi:hypothetical protein